MNPPSPVPQVVLDTFEGVLDAMTEAERAANAKLTQLLEFAIKSNLNGGRFDSSLADSGGLTLLHHAVKYGAPAIVHLLLAAGHPVNAYDKANNLPLVCRAARLLWAGPLGTGEPVHPGEKVQAQALQHHTPDADSDGQNLTCRSTPFTMFSRTSMAHPLPPSTRPPLGPLEGDVKPHREPPPTSQGPVFQFSRSGESERAQFSRARRPPPPENPKDKGLVQHSLMPPPPPESPKRHTVHMGQATPPMKVSSVPTP